MITYNRLEVLIQTFEKLKKLKGDYTIVFCDNNSTYEPLRKWLLEKESEGYLVYWNKTSELYNEIKNTVNKWYSEHDSEHFMIMDPDVELQCPSDVLNVFKHLLKAYPKISRVGVIMRWDDIPDIYPLKNKVLFKQQKLYGSKPQQIEKIGNDDVPFVFGDIDTTFTMLSLTIFSRISSFILLLSIVISCFISFFNAFL